MKLTIEELEAVYDMLQHDGWPLFLQGVEEMVSGNTLENIDTIEELWQARGHQEMYTFIKNMQSFVEQGMNNAV